MARVRKNVRSPNSISCDEISIANIKKSQKGCCAYGYIPQPYRDEIKNWRNAWLRNGAHSTSIIWAGKGCFKKLDALIVVISGVPTPFRSPSIIGAWQVCERSVGIALGFEWLLRFQHGRQKLNDKTTHRQVRTWRHHLTRPAMNSVYNVAERYQSTTVLSGNQLW